MINVTLCALNSLVVIALLASANDHASDSSDFVGFTLLIIYLASLGVLGYNVQF